MENITASRAAESTSLLSNDSLNQEALSVGVEHLRRNVLNPLLNSAIVEPYNAGADLVNGAFGKVLPDAPHLATAKNQFGSVDWFIQTASGGVGMIVPYTIAGKAAGGALRNIGATVGVEGATAAFLKNGAVANVVGAAAYDGLRRPHENETRLGNMLGGAAAFTVFGVGNHFTRELSTTGKILSRAAVGFVGADTQLITSRYTATGQLPGQQELVQAGVGGAFMNNVMPHVGEIAERGIQSAQLGMGRSVWLDHFMEQRVPSAATPELSAAMARNPWAKVKFGSHNDFDSRGRGTVHLDPKRAGHEEIARGLQRIEQATTSANEAYFAQAAELLRAGGTNKAFELFKQVRVEQETSAHNRGHVVMKELTGREVLNPDNLKLEIGAWAGPGRQTLEMRFRQEFQQFVASDGKWRPGQQVTVDPVKPVEIPKPGPGATEAELRAHEQRVTAGDLVRQLQEDGHIAVFAGGAVRDQLRGAQPKDYDIATSATPDQVQALLRAKGYTVNLTGESFGVIKVNIRGKHTPANGEEYDIATLRNDGNYTDGRRPDNVQFVASLYEDAARRDLTFNALFADPRSGTVYDFFGGQADLSNKVIRTVGKPSQRFAEDYLRMMRVPRFVAQKFPDFTIEPETRAAMVEHAPKINERVAPERIATELRLMMTGKDPVAGLDVMMDTGLMHQVLPEVAALTGPKAMQDPIWHPEGTTWAHTRLVLNNLKGNRWELMFGGLNHDIGKPATQVISETGRISNHGHAEVGAKMVRAICNRLKLSGDETRDIVGIVDKHMDLHHVEQMRRSTLLALLELPYAEDLIRLQHADAMGTTMPNRADKSRLDYIRQRQAALAAEPPSQRPGADSLITGQLLMSMGMKQGVPLGNVKKAAFEAQRNGEFTTLDEGLQWLRSRYPDLKPPADKCCE